MRWKRVAPALGCAAAIALVAVPSLTTGTSSAAPPPAVAYDQPTAHLAGTDGPPPEYPAIVDVRITRAEAALERAATAVDGGQQAAAIPEVVAARDNMVKAWTAAKYVIANTPPADPEAEAAGPYLSPADTAAGVLNLQHEIITTSLGMMDVAGPELAPVLRGTISGTMTLRDTAIEHIHSVAPPPPAEEGSVDASASAAPVGGTFDAVMPMFVPQLDDEALQANGTQMGTAPANFGAWVAFRAASTKNSINTYWPPIVDD